MKKISILFFVVVLSLSCDDNKRYITNLTVFQAELNSEFKLIITFTKPTKWKTQIVSSSNIELFTALAKIPNSL